MTHSMCETEAGTGWVYIFIFLVGLMFLFVYPGYMWAKETKRVGETIDKKIEKGLCVADVIS